MNSNKDRQRPRHNLKARWEQLPEMDGTGHGKATELDQKCVQKRSLEQQERASGMDTKKIKWTPGKEQMQKQLEQRGKENLPEDVLGPRTRTRSRSGSRSRSRFRYCSRSRSRCPTRALYTRRNQQEAEPRSQDSPELPVASRLDRKSRSHVRSASKERVLDANSTSRRAEMQRVRGGTEPGRSSSNSSSSPQAVRQQMPPKNEQEIYRQRCGVTIERIGSSCDLPLPWPMRDFWDMPFSPYLRRTLEERGIFEPTIVQSHSLPVVFEGSSLVGVTHRRYSDGKSLAYILAAIQHIHKQRPLPSASDGGPIALILMPGREAVEKIARMASVYAAPLGIRTICWLGGEEYNEEQSCALMVSTPQDLEDPRSRQVKLDRCSFLVVNGVDHFTASGLGDHICRIIAQARDNVQLLLWTVDLTPAVELLIPRTMRRDYVKIVFGGLPAEEKIALPLRHRVEIIREEDKMLMLSGLLSEFRKDDGNILIHVGNRIDVDYMVSSIGRCMPCLGLHRRMSPLMRAQVFHHLRTQQPPITLVLTQVKWRGFELPDFKYVINYDFPATLAQFTHLLSRTGTIGEAISYISSENRGQANRLVDFMRAMGETIDPRLL